MTSAPVSAEPVKGKSVPDVEDGADVVVVGATVASACTVVGDEVLAVEPRSLIGVVRTVGIVVDVVVPVDELEVDVLELVDDVLLVVDEVELDVLELVDDVLLLVDELELDELELELDELELELDVLELLDEVAPSPAQNKTWLMVGGCSPPFNGGCNMLPLVAAGSKGYSSAPVPPFTKTSLTAIVEVKSNVSSSNGSGPVTLVNVNVCPSTVNDALSPTLKPLNGLVSTLIPVVP